MLKTRGVSTMSLEDIEAIPKEILTPRDVAGYLACDPYSINTSCKAGQLSWAYMKGTRCRIPKKAFLNFHKYGSVTIINA